MAEKTAFLVLQTETPGRLLTFDTDEQLTNFGNAELNSWGWLAEQPLASSVPNNPANVIQNGWRNFLSQIPGYVGRQAGYQEALNSLFKQFVLDPRIPVSGSNRAEVIAEMRKGDPFKAGLAVAATMNMLPNTVAYDYFAAFFEIVAAETGLNVAGAIASKKRLEDALNVQSKEFQRILEDTSQQRDVFSNSNKRHSRSLLRLARVQNDSLRKLKETIEGDFALAKASINATELAYKEHMQLKAPVEYWTQKAKVHGAKAANYRNLLAGFAVVGGATLVIGLYLLGNHAIDVADKDKPPAIYVILATIGVVSSTIVFWIARVLTRLFLSEHHLGIDAEERSVMISTYLALTADGKISDNERGLALSSVFRPSSDGIVKDDGAPEFSPASLLSKVISNRP
jgi:Family of unknown function (DUF6161)